MTRLPLTALQVFEIAASQTSFAAAASVLHVTPAAIGRQIKALEQRLGYPLFQQEGRRMQLTLKGMRLLPEVRRGFSELRRAFANARRLDEPHRLNITMLSSFLQRWLLPRLPGFQVLHADVDLRISTSSSLINLSDLDYDAGIRFGFGRWTGLESTKLFDEWLVPVGRADLIKTTGMINRASDLRRFALLHAESEPWEEWLSIVFGCLEPAPRGTRIDDSAAIAMAAEQGPAIALARWSLVSADVECGRLALLSSHAARFKRSYYFVAPRGGPESKSIQVFRAWLIKTGKAFEPPPVELHVGRRVMSRSPRSAKSD